MKRILQASNVLALIFALVANYLIGAQLIGLPAINAISDKYATLLTPAEYAFSIWSLIYILLVGFAVYQARDFFKPDKLNDLPQRTGLYFIIASVCNGLWTFLFVSDLIGLSVIVLVILTISLYMLLWRLKIAIDTPSVPTLAFVWWPLMIYAGWVTAATVVNIASWLASLNITIEPWIASTIIISLGVFLSILLKVRNVRELVLAATWAIVAIGAQQQFDGGSALVAMTVFFVTGVLLTLVAVHGYINRHANFK